MDNRRKMGPIIGSGSRDIGGGEMKLTKMLLNVSVRNSSGPIQVLMSPENTAGDLIKAAIGIYVKERRRPLLESDDPRRYELHYSQFSLESLKPEEKLVDLGSRNFFLCSRPSQVKKQ